MCMAYYKLRGCFARKPSVKNCTYKKYYAKQDFEHRQFSRKSVVGPSAHRAFGKVEQNEHACPLVGVAITFKNAEKGY